MGRHAVDLLHFSVKLNELTTLVFASGSGFFVFVWSLRGILVRVFLQYFALLRGVPGAMQQPCFSPVQRSLVWPA